MREDDGKAGPNWQNNSLQGVLVKVPCLQGIMIDVPTLNNACARRVAHRCHRGAALVFVRGRHPKYNRD